MIPDRLREIAECPCCRGSGIEEVYAGYGNVAEIVCSACDGKAELASALLRASEERDAAMALLQEAREMIQQLAYVCQVNDIGHNEENIDMRHRICLFLSQHNGNPISAHTTGQSHGAAR